MKYGSTHVRVHLCRLALTRITEKTRQKDKNKKQRDTQIPSKPNIHNKCEIADVSDCESDDELAYIETTIQISQPSTSNLTPND